MDYSIKVGGGAGQGIQTVGGTLAKVFSRAGYHVFSHQDYESRIRGGHNFYQIRFSDRPVTASRSRIDIIIAFDRESMELHEKELSENVRIIYDPSLTGLTKSQNPPIPPLLKGGEAGLIDKAGTGNYLNISFVKLAIEHRGNKIMSNTVAIGAVLGMLGMELDTLIGIIKETFKKKGEDVIKGNINAAMAGHDYAIKNCVKCAFSAAPVSNPKTLTRTEQAELQFALHTAHGEFPRVIFAPGTPEQAFYLTNKAFDLTEKYQMPAIVLFDQHLADSQWTFDGFDLERLRHNDYRIRGDAFEKLSEYKRHAFTESGISPLAIPGDSRHLVVTDSDEHDEEGHLIEDAETRTNVC